MNWYLEPLKKYATFEGRARRQEYWSFLLFNVISGIVLGIVDRVVLGVVEEIPGPFGTTLEFGPLSALYALAVLLPIIAVQVRRLHDINRSGWWIVLGVVPVIGDIVLLVLSALDSQPGANKYGPNPKGVIGPGTPSPIVVRDLSR